MNCEKCKQHEADKAEALGRVKTLEKTVTEQLDKAIAAVEFGNERVDAMTRELFVEKRRNAKVESIMLFVIVVVGLFAVFK